jgi:glycosyltransferase involved in cell wall biosynthesis
LTQEAAERLQAKTILLEHAPLVRAFTDSQYLAARKPGVPTHRDTVQLANHESLRDTVSVVIPCYNEAPNIEKVTDRLLAFYGPYIHEILIVNDNSTDATESVTRQLSKVEPRIKLFNRSKPNGVGRALADGYRAATGKYILSMDCDFVEILPEFRGLFDVIAEGHDGAIGSRFSHESVMLNYPFSKMLCNRLFHIAIKFLLIRNVRDVSNNLKLYRADILKSLAIQSPHFSANLETGLKPLLSGYDIREVPISWINRTTGMGTSSFNLKRVGGDYVRALIHIWKTHGSAPNAILRRATHWGWRHSIPSGSNVSRR